jgi:hypothetical protein
MNILLPRNALLRTPAPRGRKSGAFLPAVFTGIVAAEHNEYRYYTEIIDDCTIASEKYLLLFQFVTSLALIRCINT